MTADRPAAAGRSFESIAPRYDASRGQTEAGNEALGDAIAAALALPAGAPVLDLGAGTGRLALPLARRGLRLVAVDIAPAMLAVMRERSAGDPDAPRLCCADAGQLPFRDASFAAVVAAQVIHAVGDWQATLREARRVAVPGGLLLDAVDVDVSDRSHPYLAIRRQWSRLRRTGAATAAAIAPARVLDASPEVEAFARAAGASVERRVLAERALPPSSARDLLEEIAARAYRSDAEVPDEVHRARVDQLAAWVGRHIPDPERRSARRQQVHALLVRWP